MPALPGKTTSNETPLFDSTFQHSQQKPQKPKNSQNCQASHMNQLKLSVRASYWQPPQLIKVTQCVCFRRKSIDRLKTKQKKMAAISRNPTRLNQSPASGQFPFVATFFTFHKLEPLIWPNKAKSGLITLRLFSVRIEMCSPLFTVPGP